MMKRQVTFKNGRWLETYYDDPEDNFIIIK